MPYKNIEDKKANAKKDYELNNELIKARSRRNYHNRTYKIKKISSFKSQGFRGDLEAVFDEYDKTTHCYDCSVELTIGKSKNGAKTKNADHNHVTGYYRNTICMRCNFQRQYVDRKYANVLLEMKTIHNLPKVCRRFV
tara:strand:+ start:116 stop:529 length:414 start_codon:yes stop_codon:yes gene_type:complete